MSDIIHSRRSPKKLIIFLLAAILGLAASAEAAHNVTISWDQPSSGEPVLAYQLYQNDLLICETFDPAARSITCPTELSGKGFFRVAAVYDTAGEVEPVNNPPVAQDLAVTLDENDTAASFLSATDPDNDPLNYAIVTAPTSGSVVLIDAVSGEFQYTPNQDFSGSDTFTYQAGDGSANSATATVSLTVMPVNNPPIAQDLAVTLNENETVVSFLSATDPDNDPLNYAIVTAPTSGSGVLIDAVTGEFQYTPKQDFSGSDEFTYQAGDGSANSATATVSLTVMPVNNSPVARDLGVTLNENETVVSFLSATDPDNDPLNYAIVTAPKSGAAVLIDPFTGEFQYTPQKDFSGSDKFTYQAGDGSANSATATVSLTVMTVNDPPVAQDLAVTLDANNTATSFLNATDPDNDPLNYAIETAPTSGAAVLIDSVSGEFQYTPKKDFSGSDSFTYQASDGSANSATATVSLTVMPPVNDPPVANAGPDQVVNEGETVTLDATKSADPDDGIASYSWTQLSGPSAPLSASGAVQPTFTAPDVEGEGEVLTYQLTVTDQAGLQAQDTVDISVVNKTADNQLPIASGLEVSGEEDGVLHGQLVGSDADSDPLTYTIQSAPAKGSVEMLDMATGEFSYTPSSDFNGTDSFLYSVTDGQDISGDAEVTITVLPVNDPPVANAGPDQLVNVGEMVSLDGTNSFDIDDELLTFFWIQLDGPAVNLSDPAAMQPGFEAIDNGADSTTLTFQLMVTDGEGLEATDISSVNVVWVNEPPVASAGEDQVVLEGETVTLDASGSSDSDDGISTFSWVQLSGPEMTLSDSSAMQPNFTAPDVDTAGASMVFEVTVADFGGLYATDEVIVNVSWVNTPPVADAGVDQSVLAGEIVALDGSLSSDEDDGIAKIHWTQKSGVPVTLSDPTALQPVFDAPADIVETEPLYFELAITDFGGLQHTDSCLVEVIPQQQQALVGDLNGDGVLGKDDKQLLKKSLNSCIGDQNYLESADLDGDGCVTKNDEDLWQQL